MNESSKTNPAGSHRARSVRGSRRLLLLLPSLLFLGLQLRTVSYDFVWTDHTEIEHGTLIRPPAEFLLALVEPMHRGLDFRWEGVRQPYYRPLHAIAASLVHGAVGERPAAYRTVSLVAGTIAIAIFTAFAWMVVGRVGPALFAGLVAALHPAGIEVYVWISGMSQALSVLFVLSSFLAGLGGAMGPGKGAALPRGCAPPSPRSADGGFSGGVAALRSGRLHSQRRIVAGRQLGHAMAERARELAAGVRLAVSPAVLVDE